MLQLLDAEVRGSGGCVSIDLVLDVEKELAPLVRLENLP